MSALLRERCLHHFGREAVARCPECRQFFCRECITEHEERIVCASCLARLVAPAPAQPASRFVSIRVFGGALGGCLLAWLWFYLLGRLLLAIPSDFHAGKLWHSNPSAAEEVIR